MEDRRVIVLAITLVGLVALVGAIGLGTIIVLRLDGGDDIAPGVAAFLAGLVLIASNAGSLLAPSPLSKTSGQGDVQEVTGPGGGAVPVEEVGG